MSKETFDQTEGFPEIRAAIVRLCAQFPAEYWRDLDRENAYPTDFVAALTEAGYLAALIPEAYGGAGLSLSAAAAILEEIQRAGANGAACHAQMYIMGSLLRHGSDAQKAQYLPQIASGALRLQAFGVTEPTSGSDTTSITTFAEKRGDHYVVNGQKVWTSRAAQSDLMLLLARTTAKDKVAKRTDGLSVFIVDMKQALQSGMTIRPIRAMMNHSTTEVFFDNVVVPAENLIGEEGKGFRYILSGMNAERILIAAECIGDAKWFITKATAYANTRSVFGRRHAGYRRRLWFDGALLGIGLGSARGRPGALARALLGLGRDCAHCLVDGKTDVRRKATLNPPYAAICAGVAVRRVTGQAMRADPQRVARIPSATYAFVNQRCTD